MKKLIVFFSLFIININSSEQKVSYFNQEIKIKDQLADELDYIDDIAEMISEYAIYSDKEVEELKSELYKAVSTNNTRVTKKLLNIIPLSLKKDIVNSHKRYTNLELAIKNQNKDIVKLLINNGANVTKRYGLSRDPISYARGYQSIGPNRVDIIQLLTNARSKIHRRFS